MNTFQKQKLSNHFHYQLFAMSMKTCKFATYKQLINRVINNLSTDSFNILINNIQIYQQTKQLTK